MDTNSFNQLRKIASNHILFIITLIFIQIKSFNSAFKSSCIAQDNFNTKTCFNDIIKFSDKKYRAGQILTNKDNVTTVLFSDDSPGDTRLLYSLDENGRGFFYGNETVIKKLTLTSDSYRNGYKIIGRFECISDFVYLKDDTEKEKQYIFSVTPAFFDITDWGRYIFSYRFSLFEWKQTNVYFCVFVQYEGTDHNGQDYSVSYTIVRFRLDRSTSNGQISVKAVEKSYEDRIMFDNRIVSAVPLE